MRIANHARVCCRTAFPKEVHSSLLWRLRSANRCPRLCCECARWLDPFLLRLIRAIGGSTWDARRGRSRCLLLTKFSQRQGGRDVVRLDLVKRLVDVQVSRMQICSRPPKLSVCRVVTTLIHTPHTPKIPHDDTESLSRRRSLVDDGEAR